MIIVIDGYNVLKMVSPGSEIAERERVQFITLLARYGQQAKHRLSIVFDGGSDIWKTKDERNGVMVIYSGYRDNADYVIKELLDEYQKKEVLLVSTDRELNYYAEQYDIPSMDAIDFYQLVQQRVHAAPTKATASGSQPAHKLEGYRSTAALDALMMEGSQKVVRKFDDEQNHAQSITHHKTASKKDKRLEKVLKKL